MRVLYFSRDYTTHDLRFVAAIAGWGADVRYLRLEDDGVPYLDAELPSGVKWVPWPSNPAPVRSAAALLSRLPALFEIVQAVEPDVIHAGPVQTCGLLATLLRAKPTLVMSWGSDILVDANRDAWSRWATVRALSGADAFVCDTPVVLDCARTFANLDDDEVACFPWGVELPSDSKLANDRADVRARLGWQDAIVLIASRAWHPGYGVPNVLEAFAQSLAANDRLRLILTGAGADAARIEEQLRLQPSLTSRVHRPGMVSESALSELLAAADLYVAATPSDGSSVSLLQAMAHCLPAIVVDNAGNRAWIQDRVNGWLVPAGDPARMADRVVEASADMQSTRAMGLRGHETVKARANWSSNVQALFRQYERLAGQTSAEQIVTR